MKRILIIAKWELKEKFLHKSFLVYFIISQIILFITLSLTKTENNVSHNKEPKPIAIIADTELNIAHLVQQIPFDEFIPISIDKHNYQSSDKQIDLHKVLYKDKFNACIILKDNNITIYYSTLLEEEPLISLSKYIFNYYSEINFREAKLNFEKIVSKDSFSVNELITKLSVNLIFIFIVLISGNLFLRSFYTEKSNMIIELLLSSTTSNYLIIGKAIGLLVFVFVQLGVWILSGFLFGSDILLSIFGNAEIIVFFVLGLILYVTTFTGLGALINNESDANLIIGIISVFLIVPLLFIEELIYYPNSISSLVLGFFPFTSPSTIIIKSSYSNLSTYNFTLSIVLIVFFIALIIKLISYLFDLSIQNFGKKIKITDLFRFNKTIR